ncbi:MAG TPA: serine/threonine-protein kinase [Solirubrobacteraceae bacterium]|nr:serine/threonine-protein kinase [Solirubrobacteraceae bacterium]
MTVSMNLDRYRTVKTLGSGGMATVVLAEDERLGRQVALKRLSTEDIRGVSRLRREALLGASISHPNLVAIYDVVNVEDDGLFIVMEYVPGETLGERLAREGRPTPVEALRILDGVAAGLDTIHRQGIVHRDVKPPNILLGPGGAVKLADLGIASVSDRTRITSAGTMLGSFRYMAPEQLHDAPITPAIDIYALSAVAFEALSGQKARQEPNPMALAHAISTMPPPDLRKSWPDAPPAAADVLARGLAVDPAQRPSSAGELVRRLRAAFEPPKQAAAPPPAPRPARAVAAARPTVPLERPRRVAPPPTRKPTRPAAAPLAADGADRRRNRARVGAALLAVGAAAVVLALLLSASHSPAQRRTTAAARSAHRSRPHAAPAPGASAGASRGASSAGPSSAAAAPAGNPAASAAKPAGTTAKPAGTATPASGPAASPSSAVQTFYALAAVHRYAAAWALADPGFRNQLGGYASFQGGQSGDRSITFNSLRTVSQSAGAATVALDTTSVRTDGTHHCQGTADLQSGSGSGWLVHQIHINCS